MNRLGPLFEWFLQLPAVAVLVGLWLAGTAVLGLLVAVLYRYGSGLVQMLL